MTVYEANILPSFSNWELNDCRVASSKMLILYDRPTSYARYTFKTKDFNAGNYALVSGIGAGSNGAVFFSISYQDNETGMYYSETVKVPTTQRTQNFSLPIMLQATKTDLLEFEVRWLNTTPELSTTYGSTWDISFQLIEQAIRSVDIEYASGTSRGIPPTTGWQSNAPAWQTDKYIWQRTATTFVDGHTEYSDPICIQNIDGGIYSIEEEYYLSDSNLAPLDGIWGTKQPSWSSGYYIWTRSKITWTDNSITYSEATLAKALNEANEHAEEAKKAVEKLDKDLSPDGVFKRLTDNGKRQGLYIDNGNYYFNATYIRSGIFEVVDSDNKLVFRADMSSQSVYLGGFTASNNSIYYGLTYLDSTAKGVYIGIDGITAGSGYYFVTLTNGEIHGGTQYAGQTGKITFVSSGYDSDLGTNVYGMKLYSDGLIFIETPKFAALQNKTYWVGQYSSSFYCLHGLTWESTFNPHWEVINVIESIWMNADGSIGYSTIQNLWVMTSYTGMPSSVSTDGYKFFTFKNGIQTSINN